MQVKRYEAMDMSQALRLVKDDLGPEAVILSSREINKGSGPFGVFGRPVIEVTAAIETPVIVQGGQRRYRPGSERRPPDRRERESGAAANAEALKTAAVSIEPVLDGLNDIRRRLAALAGGEAREPAPPEGIGEEMRELKSMIAFLIDHSIEQKNKGDHKNFRALARILGGQGVAPEYIRNLIAEIRENSEKNPVPDLRTLLYVTAARMRDTLVFGGWLEDASFEQGRRVVALIGPTGVGKTTTVAKIAANLTMRKRRVGLITIDTFRIAAVEQLKIYARILNIPLEVVLSPGDLKSALHAFRDRDAVLIDTAGRSQRDTVHIGELAGFFDGVEGLETRLTLSAAASDEQMAETIANFSRVGVDGLIFTKLDEATALGPVFNQQARTGAPISYFTTGQRVPEDLEEATAKRLVGGIFKGRPPHNPVINPNNAGDR